VFPEGGIWQLPQIGGRGNGREKELGYLKWGVGKLIAHSPKRPVVVPFFLYGMETVLPQNPDTKKLLTAIPQPGHHVRVVFGEELCFDDLIEEHERQHGPLWKYSASVDEDEAKVKEVRIRKQQALSVTAADRGSSSGRNDKSSSQEGQSISTDGKSDSASNVASINESRVDFHVYWDSRPEDLQLYHKITLRIEEAIRKLNERYNRDYLLIHSKD
jgi:monolysocardiolipin acyltransferase